MKKLTSESNLNLFNMKEGKEYFVDFEYKYFSLTIGVTKENNIVYVKYYDYVHTIEKNKKNLELCTIIEPLEIKKLVENWKSIIDIINDNNVRYDIDISDIRKVNLFNFVNVILFGLECYCLLNMEVIKEF